MSSVSVHKKNINNSNNNNNKSSSNGSGTMMPVPLDEETAIEMETNTNIPNGLNGESFDDDYDINDDQEVESTGLMRDGSGGGGGRLARRRHHHHHSRNPNGVLDGCSLFKLGLVMIVVIALAGTGGYMYGKQKGAQSNAAHLKDRSHTNNNNDNTASDHQDDSFSPTQSQPTGSSSSSSLYPGLGSMMDVKTFTELSHEAGLDNAVKGRKPHTVTYNPSAISNAYGNDNNNPFDLTTTASSSTWSVLTPPQVGNHADGSNGGGPTTHAYLQAPHLVNNQLVFLAEGDAYMTTLQPNRDNDDDDSTSKALSAMKLTTTVGNVLDPKWHPTLPLLAFTATYTGRRDVYLMDYRSNSKMRTPMRLTYWDIGGGVNGVVGWDVSSSPEDDDNSSSHAIVFRALSNDVSLPDYRLYKIHLDNRGMNIGDASNSSSKSSTDKSARSGHVVMEIEPVPLSQAQDAARYDGCWYFVRYKQSSHTIRYVGGTAENLWKYCDGDDTSSRLFGDDHGYRGTSKAPQMYHLDANNKPYLFFLSDRGRNDNGKETTWIPDRMNVWAVELSNKNDKSGIDSATNLIQITDTSCDFEGRTIQEFSVDAVTGNLVVRIGADLYFMSHDILFGKVKKQVNGGSSGGGGGSRKTGLRRLEETKNGTIAEDSGIDALGESNNNSSGVPVASAANATSAPVEGIKDDTISKEPNVPGVIPEKEDEDDSPVEPGDFVDTLPPKTNAETADLDDLASAPIDESLVNATNATQTEPPSKYFYDYQSPELVSRANTEDDADHISGLSSELKRLPIVVHSDFSTQQEQLLPLSVLSHLQFSDVFDTVTQDTKSLLTLRGQVWVAPVTEDGLPQYEEAGQNLPVRLYRVAPGAMMGGVTRILATFHVPNPVEDETSDRRLAVILATDPLTPTAEHAFYLIEVQPSANPLFVDLDSLPKPFLGGSVSGGSTKEGGLGSVKPDTIAVSPCGNRMAWSDTDGRIVVMNLPQYQNLGDDSSSVPKYVVLPPKNELDEPMIGDEVALSFSPGGRYLAVQHNARNQFQIISIVDLGDPLGDTEKIADIEVGRIVQATPSKFNSMNMYWGQSPTDIHDIARDEKMAGLFGTNEPDDVATTLYFLSDRDILTDVGSPWGYRQRMPHFVTKTAVYALPFKAKDADELNTRGPYPGGGAVELHVDQILERKSLLKSLLSSSPASGRRARRELSQQIHPLAGAFGYAEQSFREKKDTGSGRRLDGDVDDVDDDDDDHLKEASFPGDMNIDFGPVDLTFARQAYRVATIPEANYVDILCQTPDDGSLILVKNSEGADGVVLEVFLTDTFPSDQYSGKTFKATSRKIAAWQLSTSRNYFSIAFSPDGAIRVVSNSALGIASLLLDLALDDYVVDKTGLTLSIWPSLGYRQMYDDAWRMLRDYFYDPEMTGIDWPVIHERYLPLIDRCTKREELDDALAQMASELSALHVFVYGGEYNSPLHGSQAMASATEVGSLGAVLKRTPEWKGYTIMSIPQPDPDYTMIDQETPIYSPLSEQSLRLSGQRGLQAGDVIVGVNGESVMRVPDIHMLLRGKAGSSVRLDVLRLTSRPTKKNETDAEDVEAEVESLVVVPLDSGTASDLLYRSWEWKTQQLANELAAEAGISIGYVHLQDMSGAQAEDAFARGFFPNYHKQGFILDVRHNRGGNIDAWVLDVLQRKPWMYWKSRDFDASNGGLGWDEHYAFRGHVVVLLDEKTSSDGEGVSRGISELGLGRLIGTRTWGGGIWLASDNHLVDGGIATAPEIGTYNDHIGWGLSIEQEGVEPDIVIDNDPRESFEGKDRQLERAIQELKKWIAEEPIVLPKAPEKKRDMTMGDRECKA